MHSSIRSSAAKMNGCVSCTRCSVFFLLVLVAFALVLVVNAFPQRHIPATNNTSDGVAPVVVGRTQAEISKVNGKKDTRILSRFKQHHVITNRFDERGGPTEIVFPDSAEESSITYHRYPQNPPPALISRAKTVNCRSTNGLCEAVENYPEQEIAGILRNGGVNDVLQKLAFGKDEDSVDINNRHAGNDQEDTSFCVGVRKVMYYQWGVTRENVQKFIVNYNNVTQGVLVETCRHENKKCDIISDDFLPEDYETKCTQKYIYRRLISYDGHQVGQDSFLVPSACCCTYKKRSILSRIASPKSAPKPEKKCNPEDL